MDLGVLEHLERFISMGKNALTKEVFWLISNVLAGSLNQIQVMDTLEYVCTCHFECLMFICWNKCCLFVCLLEHINKCKQSLLFTNCLSNSHRISLHFCPQRVIDCNLMGLIVENLSRNNLRIQLVCCWCVCNLLTGGTSDQKR